MKANHAVKDLPTLGLSEALMMTEEPKEDLDKIFELLLDPNNISHNTELTKNEITAFSVLGTLRKRHNLPVLDEFIRTNLEYRVSKNRAGRKEWVKIISRQMVQNEQEQGQQSGWRRFLGRR